MSGSGSFWFCLGKLCFDQCQNSAIGETTWAAFALGGGGCSGNPTPSHGALDHEDCLVPAAARGSFHYNLGYFSHKFSKILSLLVTNLVLVFSGHFACKCLRWLL